MATITNKTNKPLSVSLPGGKKLRLGPLKSAELSPKAIDHPQLQKLVEAGEVEISDINQKAKHSGTVGPGFRRGTGGLGRSGDIRQSGDR